MRKFTDFEKMVMLDLPDDERTLVMERFDKVFGGFAVLDDIDVSGVEPLVSVLDLQNIMRDDVAQKLNSKDDLLKNAPAQHDGYFQVPAAKD